MRVEYSSALAFHTWGKTDNKCLLHIFCLHNFLNFSCRRQLFSDSHFFKRIILGEATVKILLVLRSRGREGFKGDLEEGRIGKPV